MGLIVSRKIEKMGRELSMNGFWHKVLSLCWSEIKSFIIKFMWWEREKERERHGTLDFIHGGIGAWPYPTIISS